MKKGSIFKAVSMFAAVSILAVGVSASAMAATYDVWDDDTGSRIAIEPSNGKAVTVNVDKTVVEVPMGELYVDNGQTVVKYISDMYYGESDEYLLYNHNSKVDLGAYDVSVLNSDDKIWFDSSKSSANISNIITYADEGWAYCGYTVYLQNSRGEWYNDGGAPDLPFAFDDKTALYDIDLQLSSDNTKNEPHIIVITVKGKDGSEVKKYFSYYQGFLSNSASTVSSSWASDANGWWIQNSDGSYLKDTWYQSPESGAWYYMGSDGYMLTNTTTPDGCVVNADGVWVQ